MDKRSLITEYENILLGKEKREGKKNNTPRISAFYFKGSKRTSTNAMIILYKYMIEEIMHWTPYEAKALLTKDIIQKTKLDWLTERYISFPPGLPEEKKCYYIVHLCYPRQVYFNAKEQIISVYEEALKNAKPGRRPKFPKQYFEGTDGISRACVCLQTVINKYIYMYVSSIEELYELFGTPTRIMPILEEYCLDGCCKELFDMPVDYLHTTLISSQKDDFLYRFYRFEIEFARKKKELSKNSTKKKLKEEEEITIIE